MNQPSVSSSATGDERLRSFKNITTAVYALQAASFVFPITLIVGVVVNYVKRDDTRGTWLESHCRWQIRTFWFLLLWLILGGATAPIGVGFVILFAAAVWFIYRIVKGWLYLNDGRPLPA
jgi:uncharacterized membrane protein